MKGQGTVLVMFGVTILTLMSSAVVLTGPDFSQITNNKLEGLDMISEAESRTDLTINDYMPLSVRYSTDQALGTTSLEFSESQSSEVKQITIDSVGSRAKNYLDSEYLNELGTERCRIDVNDYGLSLENQEETVAKITSTDSLVTTTCVTDSFEEENSFKVQYGSEKNSLDISLSHNRVFLMADLAQQSTTSIRSNADSVNPSGSGSVTTSCSYDSRSSAESAAESDAASEANSGLNTIESNIMSSTEKLENGVSTSTSIISSDTDTNVNNIGSRQCDCDNTVTLEDGDEECSEPVYEGSADYSYDYQSFEASISVKDSENELAQESGWEQSSFDITYAYSFDG